MKPLKNAEYQVLVFCGNTNAVVTHGNQPFFAAPSGANVYAGTLFVLPVLDRVSNKILKYLLKLNFTYAKARKRIVANLRIRFFYRGGEVIKRLGERGGGVAHGFCSSIRIRTLRVGEQILNQALHPLRAAGHETQILL